MHAEIVIQTLATNEPKIILPSAEMMRPNAGFHADQARWDIGKPCLHLGARPLLAKHHGTAIIEANDVE